MGFPLSGEFPREEILAGFEAEAVLQQIGVSFLMIIITAPGYEENSLKNREDTRRNLEKLQI